MSVHVLKDVLIQNNQKIKNIEINQNWIMFFTRFWTTMVMLLGFVAILNQGHIALVGFIFFCQILMFKEIKQLANVSSSQSSRKVSIVILHWLWFFTCSFFVYGFLFNNYLHLHIAYYSFLLFVASK